MKKKLLSLFAIAMMATAVMAQTDATLVAPDFSTLESAHPYSNNTDETVTYTWTEAGTYGIAVTFDEKTSVEKDYDYIRLYREDDTLIGIYTGTELAGKTIYVTGSGTIKIQLDTDYSGTDWGYKVTNVTAITANDLTLAGKIEPIPATFLAEGKAEPDLNVIYGDNVLTRDIDYTVEYSNNTAVGTGTATVNGIGSYTGTISANFPIVDEDHKAVGGTIGADQQKLLRQSSDLTTTSITINNGDEAWTDAVTAVKIAPVDFETGDVGDVVTLDRNLYTVYQDRISFYRREEAPVFEVKVGSGNPVTISSRWGTITYPQSAKYQISIEAYGYETTTAVVQFYTGATDKFSIIVDADGDARTTDDQTVAKAYTLDEINAMSRFQNSTSQADMNGFRTRSAYGVLLADLIEKAGVEVSQSDEFRFNTTDNFSNTCSYSQLFGDRYFLQSIYTDQDVKQRYAELLQAEDQTAADIELRRLLAEKAVAENTIAKPMISTNYKETMISSSDVATAELPTEKNTHINTLIGEENQYRFTYGITLVKEDCTVSFDTGEGSAVESQTVKSHLMTSASNTVLGSTYWNCSLIIYKGAGTQDEPSTAADRISEPAAPVREGYTFAGWYTNPECTGQAYDFTSNDGTVDRNTVFYAKWDEDPTGIETVLNSSEMPGSPKKLIRNGRMVVIKDGQIFNAAGQLMKQADNK